MFGVAKSGCALSGCAEAGEAPRYVLVLFAGEASAVPLAVFEVATDGDMRTRFDG